MGNGGAAAVVRGWTDSQTFLPAPPHTRRKGVVHRFSLIERGSR